MNHAQWVGERIQRCDSRWSPIVGPFERLAVELIAAAAPPVFNRFRCGHEITPANSISALVNKKYETVRCRKCHNVAAETYRENKRALREQRGIVRATGALQRELRVLALSMMPCFAQDVATAARCGKKTARDVMEAMVTAGEVSRLGVVKGRSYAIRYQRAEGVQAPSDKAVADALRILLTRAGIVQ